MSSNMDVDPPAEEERTISVHPLAIVHMSDQYTRITCGGSPLPKNAPVVGVLFGMAVDQNHLDIRDADDSPTLLTATVQQQVSLHQAVFPQHKVVGWYRVSKDPQPAEDDLVLTQQLQQHYAPDPKTDPFVFALLQVPDDAEDEDAASSEPQQSSMLPLMLYQLHPASQGESVALVAKTHWHLQTSEAERIAVERVVRESPHQQHDDDKSSVNRPSAYAMHASTVQHSLQSMQERLSVLVEFLEQVQSGAIDPPPLSLLRHVQQLVSQLGPLMGATPVEQEAARQEELLLSHLAVVSRTVGALQGYSEKVQLIQDELPRGYRTRMGRDPRRF